jgi:hypothetical protein
LRCAWCTGAEAFTPELVSIWMIPAPLQTPSNCFILCGTLCLGGALAFPDLDRGNGTDAFVKRPRMRTVGAGFAGYLWPLESILLRCVGFLRIVVAMVGNPGGNGGPKSAVRSNETMDLLFPDIMFMAIAYGAGAVLALAGVASLPTNFRVDGPMNWLLFTLLAPAPMLAAVTLADFVALDAQAALPPVAMAVILALPWIYFFLPTMLPDFQVDSFGAALVPAMMIGGGLFIGGLVTNSFPNGLLLGHTDSQNVFVGRSAGTDLVGKGED